MIVRVPHGPARRVPSRFLASWGVYPSHVAVCPFSEGVEGYHSGYNGVVNVPVWCHWSFGHVRAASTVNKNYLVNKLLQEKC